MKRFNADGGDEELQFEITLNNFYLGDPIYFIEDTGVSGIIYEEVYDEWLEFVEQFYFGADYEPKVLHLRSDLDMVVCEIQDETSEILCNKQKIILQSGFVCVTETPPVYEKAPVAYFDVGLLGYGNISFDANAIWLDDRLIFIM